MSDDSPNVQKLSRLNSASLGISELGFGLALFVISGFALWMQRWKVGASGWPLIFSCIGVMGPWITRSLGKALGIHRDVVNYRSELSSSRSISAYPFAALLVIVVSVIWQAPHLAENGDISRWVQLAGFMSGLLISTILVLGAIKFGRRPLIYLATVVLSGALLTQWIRDQAVGILLVFMLTGAGLMTTGFISARILRHVRG